MRGRMDRFLGPSLSCGAQPSAASRSNYNLFCFMILRMNSFSLVVSYTLGISLQSFVNQYGTIYLEITRLLQPRYKRGSLHLPRTNTEIAPIHVALKTEPYRYEPLSTVCPLTTRYQTRRSGRDPLTHAAVRPDCGAFPKS